MQSEAVKTQAVGGTKHLNGKVGMSINKPHAISTLSGDRSQGLLSASTPLSPSSNFTTSQLPSSQSLISAVCLCYWDNILGPRIQHTWYSSNHEAHHNSTLLHVCSRVLNGEICRNLAESHVDLKFYRMPDKGVLVAGFVFSARNVYGLGVHSIALVIPLQQLSRYLDKHDLVYTWVIRLIGKLKIHLNKDMVENALMKFTGYLSDLINMLSSLQKYSLRRRIDLRETTFSPSHNVEFEFIERAIASHLMTFGRSVVVGKTTDRVNLIVSTLALFNTPKERACSRYVQRDVPYHQDLWLQAILVSAGESVDIPAKEILCSKYPTTIINISNRKILQSLTCDLHSLRHYQTVKEELVCLHYDQEDELVFPESLFHIAEYPQTYVHRMTTEINLLQPSCGVREAYISQFKRFLQRKALALIKYVEAEKLDSGPSVKLNMKRLRQSLGLVTEGDYRIILAMAEKLKPGLYCYMLGDFRLDNEHYSND